MSAANGGAGGQEPTSGTQNPGQVPQANNGGTPQAPASQAPQAGGDHTQQPPWSQADYERTITELRKENAAHRTKLKTFEDAQAAADAAKLSDLEKAQKQAQDAAALAEAYRQRVAAYAVQVEAQKMGIIDPEVAAALIAGKLEFADDGTPTNADKLLKDLIAAKPYLLGGNTQQGQQPTQQQRPGASSGGATNPGAGARTGTFTRADLERMRSNPAEYAANREAIFEALRKGQIQ